MSRARDWSDAANQETIYVDSTNNNLNFNSGYGSVATAYGCRAWVNFNGTGTVAIRGGGNVSSITDISTGNYIVNFTTAMPDTNYAVVLGGMFHAGVLSGFAGHVNTALSTTSCNIESRNVSEGLYDNPLMMCSVFR